MIKETENTKNDKVVNVERQKKISVSYTIRSTYQNIIKLKEEKLLTEEEATTITEIIDKTVDKYIKEKLKGML